MDGPQMSRTASPPPPRATICPCGPRANLAASHCVRYWIGCIVRRARRWVVTTGAYHRKRSRARSDPPRRPMACARRVTAGNVRAGNQSEPSWPGRRNRWRRRPGHRLPPPPWGVPERLQSQGLGFQRPESIENELF